MREREEDELRLSVWRWDCERRTVCRSRDYDDKREESVMASSAHDVET